MNENSELIGIDLEDIKVPKNYKRPKFWSAIYFFNMTSLLIILLTFFFGIFFIPFVWIFDDQGFLEPIINWVFYFTAWYIEIIENYLGIVLSPFFFHYLFFVNLCLLPIVNNIINKTKEWEKRSNESFFRKYKI